MSHQQKTDTDVAAANRVASAALSEDSRSRARLIRISLGDALDKDAIEGARPCDQNTDVNAEDQTIWPELVLISDALDKAKCSQSP